MARLLYDTSGPERDPERQSLEASEPIFEVMTLEEWEALEDEWIAEEWQAREDARAKAASELAWRRHLAERRVA